MSKPAILKDRLCINGVRCISSFVVMKEALHGYIDNEVKKLHGDSTQKVSSMYPSGSTTGNQCGSCSSKDIKLKHGTWNINCKNRICDKWLHQILAVHDDPQNPTINWKNADISKWPTDCYEVAKIFMPKGQNKAQNMPMDLDAPAILSLMKYCNWFRKDLPNTQILSDLIGIRNKVLHSGDLRVADADKDSWIDLMIQLLNDLKIHGKAQSELVELKIYSDDAILERLVQAGVFLSVTGNVIWLGPLMYNTLVQPQQEKLDVNGTLSTGGTYGEQSWTKSIQPDESEVPNSRVQPQQEKLDFNGTSSRTYGEQPWTKSIQPDEYEVLYTSVQPGQGNLPGDGTYSREFTNGAMSSTKKTKPVQSAVFPSHSDPQSCEVAKTWYNSPMDESTSDIGGKHLTKAEESEMLHSLVQPGQEECMTYRGWEDLVNKEDSEMLHSLVQPEQDESANNMQGEHLTKPVQFAGPPSHSDLQQSCPVPNTWHNPSMGKLPGECTVSTEVTSGAVFTTKKTSHGLTYQDVSSTLNTIDDVWDEWFEPVQFAGPPSHSDLQHFCSVPNTWHNPSMGNLPGDGTFGTEVTNGAVSPTKKTRPVQFAGPPSHSDLQQSCPVPNTWHNPSMEIIPLPFNTSQWNQVSLPGQCTFSTEVTNGAVSLTKKTKPDQFAGPPKQSDLQQSCPVPNTLHNPSMGIIELPFNTSQWNQVSLPGQCTFNTEVTNGAVSLTKKTKPVQFAGQPSHSDLQQSCPVPNTWHNPSMENLPGVDTLSTEDKNGKLSSTKKATPVQSAVLPSYNDPQSCPVPNTWGNVPGDSTVSTEVTNGAVSPTKKTRPVQSLLRPSHNGPRSSPVPNTSYMSYMVIPPDSFNTYQWSQWNVPGIGTLSTEDKNGERSSTKKTTLVQYAVLPSHSDPQSCPVPKTWVNLPGTGTLSTEDKNGELSSTKETRFWMKCGSRIVSCFGAYCCACMFILWLQFTCSVYSQVATSLLNTSLATYFLAIIALISFMCFLVGKRPIALLICAVCCACMLILTGQLKGITSVGLLQYFR